MDSIERSLSSTCAQPLLEVVREMILMCEFVRDTSIALKDANKEKFRTVLHAEAPDRMKDIALKLLTKAKGLGL